MYNTLNEKMKEFINATFEAKAMITQYKKAIEEQKNKEILLIDREYDAKLLELNYNYKNSFDAFIEKINVYKQNRVYALDKFEEYDWDNIKFADVIPELISFGEISRKIGERNEKIPLIISTQNIKNFIVEISNEDDKTISEAMDAYNSFLYKFISSLPIDAYELVRIDKTSAGHDRTDLFTHSLFKQVLSRQAEQEAALQDISVKMDLLKEKYTHIGAQNFEEYRSKAITEEVKYTILSVSTTELNDRSKAYLNEILENGVRYGVFVFLLYCPENTKERNKTIITFSHHFIKFNIKGYSGSVAVEYNDKSYDFWVDYLDSKSSAKIYFDKIISYKREQANKTLLYKEVALHESYYWSKKSTTELRALMGISSKTPVELEFSDDRTHGLLVGMTGAGKTNLLHVIITSLITSYSPDEVQLYLVDLKGNEMSIYGKCTLPHAKVVAGSASLTFTWNIIADLIKEIERRKQIFNDSNCSDIKEYKKSGKIMPRILLIIDEYQELFRDSDSARENRGLLDKLFRLGRAFGIHILMSSQNVVSASGISEIYSQMSNRIALRIQDVTTAKTVIQDSVDMVLNAEKKKEAIYNFEGGRNTSIKLTVPLIESSDREAYLKLISKKATELNVSQIPLMFDFYKKAHFLERKDHPLYGVISGKSQGQADCLYVGEPLSLENPVAIQFEMVKRSNLLILGKKIDDVLGMLQSSLLSLYLNNKYSNKGYNSKFYIVDALGVNGLVTETVQDFMDSDAIEVINGVNCKEFVDNMLKSDALNNPLVRSYVILLGVHRMSVTNNEIDLLLKETTERNVHVIAFSDDDNIGDRKAPILEQFNYIIAKKGVKCDNNRNISRVISEIDDKEAVFLNVTEDLFIFRDYDVLNSDLLEEILDVEE